MDAFPLLPSDLVSFFAASDPSPDPDPASAAPVPSVEPVLLAFVSVLGSFGLWFADLEETVLAGVRLESEAVSAPCSSVNDGKQDARSEGEKEMSIQGSEEAGVAASLSLMSADKVLLPLTAALESDAGVPGLKGVADSGAFRVEGGLAFGFEAVED